MAKPYARVLTFCRRWELTPGSPPCFVSPGFLRELRRYDPALELIWHPPSGRWLVYRVAHRAVVPSMDRLVHEWTVETPKGNYALPGPWLLDLMRQNDRWSDHGDIAAAQRAFRRLQDEEDEAGERERYRVRGDLEGAMAKDIGWAQRGRASITIPS